MAVFKLGGVNPGSSAAGNMAVCSLWGQDCGLRYPTYLLVFATPRGQEFKVKHTAGRGMSCEGDPRRAGPENATRGFPENFNHV
jgi:hypothetical protein